jgi:hypothetical protein
MASPGGLRGGAKRARAGCRTDAGSRVGVATYGAVVDSVKVSVFA